MGTDTLPPRTAISNCGRCWNRIPDQFGGDDGGYYHARFGIVCDQCSEQMRRNPHPDDERIHPHGDLVRGLDYSLAQAVVGGSESAAPAPDPDGFDGLFVGCEGGSGATVPVVDGATVRELNRWCGNAPVETDDDDDNADEFGMPDYGGEG